MPLPTQTRRRNDQMGNVMFGSGTENIRPTGAVLGWSFWSRPNFQNAYSGTHGNASTFADARYLTVDGVDPLMASYRPYSAVSGAGPCASGTCPAGTIPTLANGGLSAVTFPHIIDGSYPIWSFLRLVCVGSGTAACTAAQTLATSAQNFVALGPSVTSLHPPDFVPVTSSTAAWNSVVVRSHFTPPGTTIKCTTVANGTTLTTITAHKAPECGGDVGGVVYTVTGDIDYETDFQPVLPAPASVDVRVTVPEQVAVPLVQVAVVGGAVHPDPPAVGIAVPATPPFTTMYAVVPEQELLKLARVTNPVPDRAPPLT